MALNNQEFEELVQQLQNQSFEDARSTFGEKGFNRWRNPQYHGRWRMQTVIVIISELKMYKKKVISWNFERRQTFELAKLTFELTGHPRTVPE